MIKLHSNEVWLIKKWRNKYRFGEITITIQNGVPQRIKKVIFNEDPRDEIENENKKKDLFY